MCRTTTTVQLHTGSDKTCTVHTVSIKSAIAGATVEKCLRALSSFGSFVSVSLPLYPHVAFTPKLSAQVRDLSKIGRPRTRTRWATGPADHEKDSAEEEPCPQRTRINEAGDAVPGSEGSITQGIRNLGLQTSQKRSPFAWSVPTMCSVRCGTVGLRWKNR